LNTVPRLIRPPVFALLACLPLLLEWQPPPSAAQPEGPLEYPRADRTVIRGQLELSVAYSRQAISLLQAAATPEEIHLASDTAFKAYALARFAYHGMEMILARKSNYRPLSHYFALDPLLNLAMERVWDGRMLIISARLDIGVWSEEERPSRIAAAIEKLTRSIALFQEALGLI
jgi:hypothetical protein